MLSSALTAINIAFVLCVTLLSFGESLWLMQTASASAQKSCAGKSLWGGLNSDTKCLRREMGGQ